MKKVVKTVNGKTRMRKILSLLLGIVTAGLAVLYFVLHKEDFRLITTVSTWPIITVSMLKLIEMYFRGRELKIITDHYKLNLRFSQWFGLTRIMAFTNLFLPSFSGTSVKAVYLKKYYNFKFSSFIAATGIANIIRLMLFALSSIVLISISGKYTLSLLIVSGIFFICTFTFLMLSHKIPIRLFAFMGKLSNIVNEWHDIRNDRNMIVKLITLNVFIYLIFSSEIYFSFRVFSIDPSVVSSGVISSFAIFSRVIKLIPANLGVKELIFSAISNVYGQGVNEGLHAAAFHRIVGMVFILLLAPGFIPSLFRRRIKDVKRELEQHDFQKGSHDDYR